MGHFSDRETTTRHGKNWEECDWKRSCSPGSKGFKLNPVKDGEEKPNNCAIPSRAEKIQDVKVPIMNMEI